MDEIITNEFIQYKMGFTNGKNDIIELTRLGKIIDSKVPVDKISTEWAIYGYKDAIEYFSEAMNQGIDVAAIRVRDVVKEIFPKRVVQYNTGSSQELPISTFRVNK